MSSVIDNLAQFLGRTSLNVKIWKMYDPPFYYKRWRFVSEIIVLLSSPTDLIEK
jgi:hypothetical protein